MTVCQWTWIMKTKNLLSSSLINNELLLFFGFLYYAFMLVVLLYVLCVDVCFLFVLLSSSLINNELLVMFRNLVRNLNLVILNVKKPNRVSRRNKDKENWSSLWPNRTALQASPLAIPPIVGNKSAVISISTIQNFSCTTLNEETFSFTNLNEVEWEIGTTGTCYSIGITEDLFPNCNRTHHIF